MNTEEREIMNPNQYLHAFKTFLGIPPSKGDRPACGAILTDAYDFPGVDRPVCPECEKLLAAVKS